MKLLGGWVALGLAVAIPGWAATIDPVAVTLTNPVDVVTRREALIKETWGRSTLPATLPAVSRTYNPFGSYLPRVGAVYDYHATMSNWQVNDSFLYMNSRPNGRVAVLNMGHTGTTYWPSISPAYNTVPTMASLLNAGFSIYAMNMPGSGQVPSHVALFSRYGNAAVQYFLEPAIQAMNYWDAHSTFSQYDYVGLSGGAWTGTLLQALDTRVQAAVVDAGSLPGTQFCCREQPLRNLTNQGDNSKGGAEQSWAPFYSIAG